MTYTQLRNVKKPSGAKPGYVVYFSSQTAYVTPPDGLVDRLAGEGPFGGEKEQPIEEPRQ